MLPSHTLTFALCSDPVDAATSNNPTNGFDRFQLFDPDSQILLDLYRLNDYDKFSKNQYPLLFWEPSDQDQIASVAETYLEAPFVPGGFRFAINIDLVMLQVYAASQSGTAWNQILTNGEHVNPFALVLDSNLAVSNPLVLVTLYQDLELGSAVILLNTFASLSTQTWGDSLQQDLPFGQVISLVSFDQASLGVIASCADGSSYLLEIQASPLKVSVVSWFNSSVFRLFPIANQANTFIAATQNENCSGIALGTASLDSSLDLVFPASSELSCIQGYFDLVQSAFAGVVFDESNTLACATPDIAAVAFFAEQETILASALCIPAQNDRLLTQSALVSVDVGSFPSLAIVQSNNQSLLLETHTNGFCWNSETHNKQPTPALCDLQPIVVDQLMVYNFARFEDFVDSILTKTAFSSCHPSIMHGAYDWGMFPSAAFSTQPDGSIALISVHTGISSNVTDPLSCGIALPHQGLVVDAWPASPYLE